ncbi:DUF4240 domain-containing protein [Hymenobacter sp. BT635]|uniref:DUF4240 domain-containing protein n=1 Tax=Hymenobacter nitidus TaxID=2880929 RepID=A0ABS8A7U3_9BACT|nr:DUF4240 domain-containing protein [Hymenobacter nitidus]MCB2376465.1 DUF4240 domain-containing protein [Hymenobacter nitidus]
MDKKEFWHLLDAAKAEAAGNQERQQQHLVARLTEREPEQIIEFECLLRQYIIEADDFTVMAAQKIIDGYVSDDSYLYFRCWLVGQGETVFANALRSPDTLADVVQEPYQDFEQLLYVATIAFAERTGQPEEDETFPRAQAEARGLDYGPGSVTKGEDWTDNQLPRMLPRLWKKFGA